MFSQDSLKNVLLILVVIVVFSGVGFYTAFYMQEDKITGIVSEKNSTVTRLSSEVVYLRNVFDDLLVQYERLEDQVEELRDEAAQQSAEYERLSQMYAQLNGSHQGLLDDYRALNASYVHETEAFLNKTTMQKDYIRVYLNNVSLEYHQDTAVSLDGPHVSVPTNCSQLITGWPQDGRTTVTLSWSHVEDEPDLNATLTDARGSIELYVNKTSLNHTLVKDDYRVLYYNFTIEMGQEMRYMLISTWYMSDTGHQYLCVVQQDEDTVVDAFLELMARFERN
jgi:hypothetical protein